MGPEIAFTLLVCAALPIAWMSSEFQPRRWLRIVLGCLSIAACFLVASTVGSMQHFNANAWYGFASMELIDVTVEELEAGNGEQVVQELKVLQSEFQPTYENRARYDVLVQSYVSRLGHQPADSLSR